jgi:Fe-S-cluster containining protein
MVDTFYLHLQFKGKNEEKSINLPFLCNKCGICCTLDDFLTAGEITAKPKEHPEVRTKIKNLFEELGKMWQASETKYDQYIQQTPCPFLKDNFCSIYEIRPDGCRLFPKTAFGMQTQDCPSLKRFKKMRTALKKGRHTKENYYFAGTSQKPIKSTKLTEKQYQTCLKRLRQTGITDDELDLFNHFNGISLKFKDEVGHTESSLLNGH